MALDNAFPTPASTLSTMTQWEDLFALIGSGVIPGVGNEFVPSINSGSRQVIIDTGQASIRGFFVNGSSATTTAVPTASSSPRIDRLVLRLDRTASTAPNWIKPVVITGSPASSPVAPAISSSLTGSWDLPMCQYRANTDGSLSNLIDERYWLAGPTARMTSASRPPAAPARLGIETDTHRVLWADGSSWNGLTQDTGWVTLTLASGFTQGSTPLSTRIVNGVGYLSGVIIAPSSVSAVDYALATLPSMIIPSKSIEFPVYEDGGTLLLAIAYASGSRYGQVWLTGNTGSLGSLANLRMTTSWPI